MTAAEYRSDQARSSDGAYNLGELVLSNRARLPNWGTLFEVAESAPFSTAFRSYVERAIHEYSTLERGVGEFHRSIVSSLFGNWEIFESPLPELPSLELLYVFTFAYPEQLVSVSYDRAQIRALRLLADRLNMRLYCELKEIAEQSGENVNTAELAEAFVRAARQVRTVREILRISEPSPALLNFLDALKTSSFGAGFTESWAQFELKQATKVLRREYTKHLRLQAKGVESNLPNTALAERLFLSPDLFFVSQGHNMPAPFGDLELNGMQGARQLRIPEMQTVLDSGVLKFCEGLFGRALPLYGSELLLQARVGAQQSHLRLQRMKLAIAGTQELFFGWFGGKWW